MGTNFSEETEQIYLPSRQNFVFKIEISRKVKFI